jgi:hypothetical protein
MKTLLTFSFFIVFFVGANSCQTYQLKPDVSQEPPSVLNLMGCENLVEKSRDESFPLKALAGLRAHKNCKNFKFDFQKLTELEKKIFS